MPKRADVAPDPEPDPRERLLKSDLPFEDLTRSILNKKPARLAGHGPTLFAGLSKHVGLKLVSRLEFGSGQWRCGMSREGGHRSALPRCVS
jgi:hypothetical protein